MIGKEKGLKISKTSVANKTLSTFYNLGKKYYGNDFGGSDENVGEPKIVLREQLYFALGDRTRVDVELETCRSNKELRTFNISGIGTAVMLESSYRALALNYHNYKRLTEKSSFGLLSSNNSESNKRAKSEPRSKKSSSELEKQVLRDFHNGILLHWTDLSITKDEVITFLSLEDSDYLENVFMVLSRTGFLVRKTDAPSGASFHFSFPGIGKIGERITEARRNVLSRIKRNRYKEILASEIARTALSKERKKRKRKSSSTKTDKQALFYGAPFHLDDIIGAGLVRILKTPAGPLLKLND